MKIWFTLIDFLMPLVIGYLILKKGSISIVYVPFFYFMFSMLEKSKMIGIYHAIFLFLLLYYVINHLPFLKRNVFYIILILFFSFQLKIIDDFKSERMLIISFYWLFTVIVLAPEICKNYTKEQVFNELSKASFLILFFFILNSSLATLFGYYPMRGYRFTSGVSFGMITTSHYNVLPLAIFLVFRKGLSQKNFLYLVVGVASLFLTMLTLRRVAMLLSVFGVLVAMIELLNFKQIKQFAMYFLIFGVITAVVLKTTGFVDAFQERMERRNLVDRDFEEEGRFKEFGLLYKDLFVYYDYDPWFGYGPLSSKGNYGKKIFGNRPLHSEIPLLIHGFGFFGLFLILSLYFMVFFQSWQRTETKSDKLIFMFVLGYFFAYMVNGFPKAPMSPILLFMMLGLPLCSKHNLKSKTIKPRNELAY
jgi:hypothetical protein